MGTEGKSGGLENHNPIFRCMAHKHRRAALEALLTWGSPQTERRVVAYIVANERGTPSINEPDDNSIQNGLVHNHFPALEDTNLIKWDRNSREIRTTDHPAINDPRFQQLLSLKADGLDEVFDGLAHEYRRIILTVLRDSCSAMSPEELVREICRRQGDESEPLSDDLDEVRIALHHTHLPKLTTVGFIESDSETGKVSYAAHPVLEEVFAIIYNPSEALTEKATKFFDELQGTMEQSKPDSSPGFDWPHFWRYSPNG